MCIQRLPVELFRRILIYLDIYQLLKAAHVCQLWRQLAFDNPSYWADIRVTSVTPSALDLAEHRMLQGRKRPFRFTMCATEVHNGRNDPVLKRLIPMLRSAVPYAYYICITVESMYRLNVEEALSGKAPFLRTFFLKYTAEPEPELPLRLPLGHYHDLFAGLTGQLREVRLWDVILPGNTIPATAFREVDEIWWMNALTTRQEKFPCYLFDFFPNCSRLRMKGGNVWFTNAPLPPAVVEKFRTLKWVDLEFPHPSLPAFFQHLPLDDLEDLNICSPDEDHVYRTLEPLRSQFHLDFSHDTPNEFVISLQGRDTRRVRRFAEPLKYYYPDSADVNALLENEEFLPLIDVLSIHITLWRRLKPWLHSSYPLLPKLILVLNENTQSTVALPEEPISCPTLSTLVLQTANDVSYVDAEDVVVFADRLTTEKIALELRRVVVIGDRDLLPPRFVSVESYLTKSAICIPM